MWEYKGHSFEGDVADADFSDRFEKVMQDISTSDREIAANAGTMRTGDVIRAQCKAVDDALDVLFGEGTAAAIFGGRANLIEHLDALADLAEWGIARKKEINDVANRYAQRYQNRAQRRKDKRRHESNH